MLLEYNESCTDKDKYMSEYAEAKGKMRTPWTIAKEAMYDAGAAVTVSISACADIGFLIFTKSCVGVSLNPGKVLKDIYEQDKEDQKWRDARDALTGGKVSRTTPCVNGTSIIFKPP